MDDLNKACEPNHRPKTPLPWNLLPSNASNLVHIEAEANGAQVCSMPKKRMQDAEFIYHACNAYPKLIEFLICVNGGSDDRALVDLAGNLMQELGEAE